MLEATVSRTEFPILLCAFSKSFAPRRMLTNAPQPSPIIVAIARAMTVSGNTIEFAALPKEPG